MTAKKAKGYLIADVVRLQGFDADPAHLATKTVAELEAIRRRWATTAAEIAAHRDANFR